jgi:hypothetical protein
MRRRLLGDDWWASPVLWIEWFLVANLAFLAIDIFLAHAVNEFENRAEWIPIGFSLSATFLLLAAMALGGSVPRVGGDEPRNESRSQTRPARAIGLAVGWGAIVVGVAGLLWHLQGDFFQEQTLKNLVYTAPFVAPLAYTGLGFLLLLDRMVDHRSLEWSRWVILLAAGGFVGNFVLSLADHAENGFFYPTEWIGVVAGGIAVGFLLASVIVFDGRLLLLLNLCLMVAQMVVGVLGFVLHGLGNLSAPGRSLWDNFVFGAPIFAPLLFADLAVLALLGLWAQARWLASGGAEADRASASQVAGRAADTV